jgi:hypothetical protein
VAHRALLTAAGLLAAALLAAADPPEPKQPDPGKAKAEDEEHRAEAGRAVGQIEVEELVDGEWFKVKRVEKALLYHGDATRGHTRGSVWAWGVEGRPVVLLELWQNGTDRTRWACGLCNTSGGKVRATRGGTPWWRENASAAEPTDIPTAPVPAADGPARQRQLKLIASKFAGHEFWDPDNTRYELRRLERPLHTYRDEAGGLLDGAMYVLANGTNPEIMLFVEARAKPGEKPVWQFTVGRMSHSELHVVYDGKEVFSGPRGRELSGPDKPYWVSYIPVPPPPEPKK